MTPFRELAEVFQTLEQTSSNTALITILANFLSRLSPDEARAVAYLLRGEVAAPFESLEIGMAERMALRAVADAYGTSEQQLTKLLAKTGDLGTVVQVLRAAARPPQSRSFVSLAGCKKLLRFPAKARNSKNLRDWRNCFQAHRGSKQNISCAQFSAPIALVSPT
jgi:DNA ligase N terminus